MKELILNYIKEYKTKNGYNPSYAAIAAGLGKTNYKIQREMESLRDQGIIKTIPNRGYILNNKKDQA